MSGNINRTDAFTSADGSLFRDEQTATNYQKNQCREAIDLVMKGLGKDHPDIHYPNLSLMLVPYMEKHAVKLMKALSLHSN